MRLLCSGLVLQCKMRLVRLQSNCICRSPSLFSICKVDLVWKHPHLIGLTAIANCSSRKAYLHYVHFSNFKVNGVRNKIWKFFFCLFGKKCCWNKERLRSKHTIHGYTMSQTLLNILCIIPKKLWFYIATLLTVHKPWKNYKMCLHLRQLAISTDRRLPSWDLIACRTVG